MFIENSLLRVLRPRRGRTADKYFISILNISFFHFLVLSLDRKYQRSRDEHGNLPALAKQ